MLMRITISISKGYCETQSVSKWKYFVRHMIESVMVGNFKYYSTVYYTTVINKQGRLSWKHFWMFLIPVIKALCFCFHLFTEKWNAEEKSFSCWDFCLVRFYEWKYCLWFSLFVPGYLLQNKKKIASKSHWFWDLLINSFKSIANNYPAIIIEVQI